MAPFNFSGWIFWVREVGDSMESKWSVIERRNDMHNIGMEYVGMDIEKRRARCRGSILQRLLCNLWRLTDKRGHNRIIFRDERREKR